MGLSLSKLQYDTLCAHGAATYPEECCGVLVGRGEAIASVIEVVPLVNVWGRAAVTESLAAVASEPRSDSRRRNFAIAPADLLRVQRQASDRHLAIIGIYHSHPDHPAIPSEFDQAIAWPDYDYLILSVHQGQTVAVENWRLNEHGELASSPLLFTP
jgi:proteasome lid subunit RPN8/RPN11